MNKNINMEIKEWFIWLIQGIAQEDKVNQEITNKYIKQIQDYKENNYFEAQAIAKKFIKEEEERASVK